MIQLKLNPQSPFTLVDGNNFLINKIQSSTNSLIIREAIQEINSCATPPMFIFDPYNGNERRKRIYPDYKKRREDRGQSYEDIYRSLQLFRDCLPHTACISVRADGWEADDVIATIALHRSRKGQPTEIISTDRDLAQLAVHKGVTVFAHMKDVDDADVRLYKTFVGDQSDSIPGVPGFGEKSWHAVQPHAATIKDFFNQNWWDTTLDVGLKPKQAEWCAANFALLSLYYDIIGLFTVPEDEIVQAIVSGVKNDVKVNSMLLEFML